MGKAIDAILSASLLQEGEKPPCGGWSKSCSRLVSVTTHLCFSQRTRNTTRGSGETVCQPSGAGGRKKRHV